MILFGPTASPYVRKVLAFAAEKGVRLEQRPHVGPGGPDPDWLAASPFRKVPALQHDDFRLSDSSVIIAYIEKLHPEPALIPAAPRAHARALWLEELGDTFVAEPVRRVFFHRVIGRLLGRPVDPAIADTAEREELPPVFDFLESLIPDSEFLLGDRLTLADIALASPLLTLRHLDLAVDEGRWPRLADFVARMTARPSFAALEAAERAELGR